MSKNISRINSIIDNHIYVWSSVPPFAPMAEVLRNHRDILVEKLMVLSGRQASIGGSGPDAVRLFLINFATERIAGQSRTEHPTAFGEPELAEVIEKESYEDRCQEPPNRPLIPHLNEAIGILARCLFDRTREGDDVEAICFLRMFSRSRTEAQPCKDRTIRIRSMIWFIYLAIEIAKTEPAVCSKGLEHFSGKFRELLDRSIGGTIIKNESVLTSFDYGKWDNTLFGWLQCGGWKGVAEELKHRFNLNDDAEDANACLLADDRKCVLEKIMTDFSEKKPREDLLWPVCGRSQG